MNTALPIIIGWVIPILLTFLKSTVKNADSATAQKLKVVLTMVRDSINDFLTVFAAHSAKFGISE